MALHDHLLVAQLLRHILGRRAGYLDPRLREERACNQDEHQVEDGVDRVGDDLGDRIGRREVVDEAADGRVAARARRLILLPPAEPADEHVVREALVHELREEVEVGDKGGLQDDGHVGGVEELDGVRALHAALGSVLDRQVHAEALEVDDDEEDEHRRHEVRQVGQVLAVEGLLDALPLIGTRDDEVEEGDEGALELGAAARVDRRRRERLPHDGLADVGRDEERDAGAEPIPLLEQLVEDDDDDAGDEELQDDQDRVARAQLAHVTIHARDDVRHRLTHRDQDPKELLSAREECTVFLEALVDVDDLGAGEQLHDQAGSDDGRDAQLHERPSVRGEQHTHPVERVRALVRFAAVDWDLAADKEDEERDRRPQHLLLRTREASHANRETGAVASLRRAVRPLTSPPQLRNRNADERHGICVRLYVTALAVAAASHTLNGIFRSGGATSGSTCSTGLTSVRKRSLPVDMAQRCGVREAQWDAVSRQSAPMRQSRVRCTRRRQHALALRRRAVVTQARPRHSIWALITSIGFRTHVSAQVEHMRDAERWFRITN